jgi:hypothetical protein
VTAPMCAEHHMPVVECENVTLTRSRRAPMCMCGHPKAVHQHWRTALDCEVCDCLHYEGARRPDRALRRLVWVGCGLCCAAFWLAVGIGVAWPLIQAVRGAR